MTEPSREFKDYSSALAELADLNLWSIEFQVNLVSRTT